MENDASDEHLFSGCPLTLDESTVLLTCFIARHKLSMKAAGDLIQLMCAHFPEGHFAMTSLYRLRSAVSCPNSVCVNAKASLFEFLVLNVVSALGKLFKGSFNVVY